MNRLLSLLLVLILGCCACNKTDPEPENIRAYWMLYNFLMSDPVVWEIDQVEIPDPQDYGQRFQGAVVIEEATVQISFTAKYASNGQIIESRVIEMSENKNYLIFIMGSEEDPVILYSLDNRVRPASGMIMFQFLHADESQDAVDVYMGGTSPEYRRITGIGYEDISANFEVKDYEARFLVTIARNGEPFDPDSALINYDYNDPLQSEAAYLVVFAREQSLPAADLFLWLYPLPSVQ